MFLGFFFFFATDGEERERDCYLCLSFSVLDREEKDEWRDERREEKGEEDEEGCVCVKSMGSDTCVSACRIVSITLPLLLLFPSPNLSIFYMYIIKQPFILLLLSLSLSLYVSVSMAS